MSKGCFNIFARECPACKTTVPWSKRKLLLKQEKIQCAKCKSKLIISPRDRLINTFFLVSMICCIDNFSFDEPSQIRQIILFFGAMIFEIPKFMNIMFSLVQADKNNLKDYA